jgi:hypothetical protein
MCTHAVHVRTLTMSLQHYICMHVIGNTTYMHKYYVHTHSLYIYICMYVCMYVCILSCADSTVETEGPNFLVDFDKIAKVS